MQIFRVTYENLLIMRILRKWGPYVGKQGGQGPKIRSGLCIRKFFGLKFDDLFLATNS